MTTIDKPKHPDMLLKEAIVVRAPRPTDAIGTSLWSAFAVSRALPSDLAVMLDRLDRIP